MTEVVQVGGDVYGLGERLGGGAWGEVFAVEGQDGLVMKCFKNNLDAQLDWVLQGNRNRLNAGDVLNGHCARVDSVGDEGVLMERCMEVGESGDVNGFLSRIRFMVAAVVALQAQNLVHGDLNPSNVMSRADGSLVLVDFDGMRQVGEEIRMFNPKYAGLEVQAGAVASRSLDVHALGVMILEELWPTLAQRCFVDVGGMERFQRYRRSPLGAVKDRLKNLNTANSVDHWSGHASLSDLRDVVRVCTVGADGDRPTAVQILEQWPVLSTTSSG